MLDDELFNLLLAQKGVTEVDDIKSFTDYDEQLVAVRSRMRPDHRRELVMHELLHAALDDTGIEQDERSEKLISVLAPRIVQLLDASLVDVLQEVS
jgi:Zn-dependent peptidase ImmA (M78 family)